MWFHVDKVSSAHVYLRLKKDQTLDDVPMSIIEDAAQLVKANSIQGNKMNDIDVVYTMWENLHKTDSMQAGEVSSLLLMISSFLSTHLTFAIPQVGFKKQKEVRKIRVSRRENAIVNRLNKTKVEKNIDFR